MIAGMCFIDATLMTSLLVTGSARWLFRHRKPC